MGGLYIWYINDWTGRVVFALRPIFTVPNATVKG